MKTSLAIATAFALFVTTFLTVIAPAPTAHAAGGETGTVTGYVFENFSTTGWLTSGASGIRNSVPGPRITVTAYDAVGNVVGSTESLDSGSYSLPVAGAYSKDLRVEFSGWEAPFEPAFAAQGNKPAGANRGNDTSVQFVTLPGGDQPVSGVDFGLIQPDQVIQPNAPIATAIQSAGAIKPRPNPNPNPKDPPFVTSEHLPSLVAQPWGKTGQNADDSAISRLVNFGETGAVWGTAYSKQANDIFLAATVKRASALGPQGLGAIYRVHDVLNADGSVRTSQAPLALAADLNNMTVSNRSGKKIDLGYENVKNRAIGQANLGIKDAAGFTFAGRVGMGDIVTSPDGSRLFATNLHDGEVYALDISNPDVVPDRAYLVDTPVTARQAIWAIEIHNGKLYIGYVDTGQKTDKNFSPGQSADDANMQAFVASTPLASVLNGESPVPNWTNELTVPLGYKKGSNVGNFWFVDKWGGRFPLATQFPALGRWNSWTGAWSWPGGTVARDGELNTQAYPQAILGSLAFDSDGYLNLGFIDRNSLQASVQNIAPDLTGNPKNPPLWNGVSNGDILVAAPGGNGFVLESAGKVGSRNVRTSSVTTDLGPGGQTGDKAQGTQQPTFNNSQGPGGGEFFNDTRELGTEATARSTNGDRENHNEIGLGSVTAFPGLPEIAATTIDPRSKSFTNGIMWFDRQSGAATRGIDLVQRNGESNKDTGFQKAGGLGGTALLAVKAPVEIGNRVWLDADMNGRQDADEPAINGAEVQLWTNNNGRPGAHIATRVTKTIDGQPGTYYFRTDDADVMAGRNANPFVDNAQYVLVFKKGSSIALAGPDPNRTGANADHPGFEGLAWSDLALTSPEVRGIQNSTTGATEVNDSNPNQANGEYRILVGGPGKNNHTYDAGWVATNNYSLLKKFDFGSVPGTPNSSYTFDVVSAENFRGQNMLNSGYPDARLTESTMEIKSVDNWKWTSTDRLPLGYRIVLEERGATNGSVTWSEAAPGNTSQGVVNIKPATTLKPRAEVTATNAFGGFSLRKTISGAAASKVAPAVKFKISYILNGGAEESAWVSKNTPFELGNLPIGTTVQIKESSPIVTDPAVVAGVDWGVPVWTVGSHVQGPDTNGWYSFTVSTDQRTTNIGLNNVANPLTGGFSIAKTRAPGEPLPNQKFSFQYKVGETGTPVTLGPIAAGESVRTPNTIAHGSTVFVREIAPADTSSVRWDTPVWSGLPAGAGGPDSNGWRSFTFNVQAGADLQLTVTNRAEEQLTGFSIGKIVTVVAGSPNVTDKEFSIEYRTAPAPVAGAQPVFGTPTTIVLKDDETWTGLHGLAIGTVVETRETAPVNEPGVGWASPQWKVNGGSATMFGDWARFTLNSTTTAEFIVDNRVTERTGGFTLAKALDGTGSSLVRDLNFPVEVQIGADQIQTVDLKGNGETWTGPSNLSIGTEVRVREVTPLPVVEGIEWGTPSWNASTGTVLNTVEGWTVFTITSDSETAALTLTNKPKQLFGSFQLEKKLVKTGDPALPANYTFEVKFNNGAINNVVVEAGKTSRVFNNMVIGTVVSVREVPPPAVAGVDWDVAWKIDGEASTQDENGWVAFTVTDTTLVSLLATNSMTQKFGGFQVAKTLSGDGKNRVPADTPFVFAYTLNGGSTQHVTATAAEMSERIGGLSYGTEVSVQEVEFPHIPGIEFSDSPVWTLNGAPATSPVKFMINGTNIVALSVNNTATEVFGSFKITKSVTGADAGRVPENASFTVNYSTDNGSTWASLGDITKGSPTVSSGKLPIGTRVLLKEAKPANGVDYAWGTPSFILNGVAQGQTAAFTISDKDTPVAVQLNNPATPLNGNFAVRKVVDGDFALSDKELAGLTFTVNWTAADLGRSGSLKLNAANGWKATQAGASFPRGTEITLTEVEPTGLPVNVDFDKYQWLSGVNGVDVSTDRKTATLTVGAGTPVLQLENKFDERTGTFKVEKLVEGDFDIESDKIKDLAFTVNYSASNGATGRLILDAAGNWKADVGVQFPTGTTVRLTEAPVGQSQLDPNVQWTGYTWLDSDDYKVSDDKLVATITIGDGTSAALKLRNGFEELRGSFAVQKSVTGDFELTDPALSGQSFVVKYTADKGKTFDTLRLSPGGGWSAAGPELPAGTEVTITEVAPLDLAPNVAWTGYRWIPSDELTISEDGQTATFTVDSETIARLDIENSFTELNSNFEVLKVVEGDFALSDPELSSLTFTVDYTATNGTTGKLTLNQAGEWKAKPGAELPLGTQITLTEADVAGLPAHVAWDGYQWLPGSGYAVSTNGKTATFTLTSETVMPQLTLQNEFSKLIGGFDLTKGITGDKAAAVPDDAAFVAEYSLDGGQTWVALPVMTKGAPKVAGPNDVPLGTTVLIRETAPEAIPGITWETPAFSGDGVTPGVDGEPASFIITSTGTSMGVLLENPTSPDEGNFSVQKLITGSGDSLLLGDPVFTVKYRYEGQRSEGVLKVTSGNTASSELIPSGTIVTLTEITPDGGLVDGASWGTPVFVTSDGTVLKNGSTLTVGKGLTLNLVLENPTIPPSLPPTGGSSYLMGLSVAMLLLGLGAVAFGYVRLRGGRDNQRRRLAPNRG